MRFARLIARNGRSWVPVPVTANTPPEFAGHAALIKTTTRQKAETRIFANLGRFGKLANISQMGFLFANGGSQPYGSGLQINVLLTFQLPTKPVVVTT